MPPHTASPWDADAESDPDALYSPSRVVNLPSYDTKHLDALEYRLRELGGCGVRAERRTWPFRLIARIFAFYFM